jgi:hypothetical protein
VLDCGPVKGYARTATAIAIRVVSVGAGFQCPVRVVAVTYLVDRTFFDTVPFGIFPVPPELVRHGSGQAHYTPVLLPEPQKFFEDEVPFRQWNEEATVTAICPVGRIETEPDPLDGQRAHLVKKLFEVVPVLSGDGSMDNRFTRGLSEVLHGTIVSPLSPYAVMDFSRSVEGQDPLRIERGEALRTVCKNEGMVKYPGGSLTHPGAKHRLSAVNNRRCHPPAAQAFHEGDHRPVIQLVRSFFFPPIAMGTIQVAAVCDVDGGSGLCIGECPCEEEPRLFMDLHISGPFVVNPLRHINGLFPHIFCAHISWRCPGLLFPWS